MIIGALMTVYNEAEYADYAIRSALEQVDYLSIVEGAYQETLKMNPGKTPRSNDGTLDIISRYKDHPKVNIIYANEKSDPQQRNVGLQFLKDKRCDWILIIDADEIWDTYEYECLKDKLEAVSPDVETIKLDILVFVNNFLTYTNQTMSRVFRMHDDLIFISDNETQYHYKFINWHEPKFFHYAYVKNKDRFNTKINWWKCRGGSDWFVDKDGNYYSPNHTLYHFYDGHPCIMESHPRFEEHNHDDCD
jgi:glycosyltransferase involved in cell wall biosynthesis